MTEFDTDHRWCRWRVRQSSNFGQVLCLFAVFGDLPSRKSPIPCRTTTSPEPAFLRNNGRPPTDASRKPGAARQERVAVSFSSNWFRMEIICKDNHFMGKTLQNNEIPFNFKIPLVWYINDHCRVFIEGVFILYLCTILQTNIRMAFLNQNRNMCCFMSLRQ